MNLTLQNILESMERTKNQPYQPKIHVVSPELAEWYKKHIFQGELPSEFRVLGENNE